MDALAENFASILDGGTTITPIDARIGLTITQAYNAVGLKIDSESTTNAGLESYGFVTGYFEQNISSGYGLEVKRDIAEASSYPIVKFTEDNVAGTQPVLQINNDGSGKNIEFGTAVSRYQSYSGADVTNPTNAIFTGYTFHAGASVTATGYIPIHLPNGVIVTSFKTGWRREAGGSATARLNRLTIPTSGTGAPTVAEMAAADFPGNDNNQIIEDTTISNGTIDNTLYAYYITISMTTDVGQAMNFNGSIIKYTITEPLP